MKESAPPTIRLADYRPPSYLVDSVTLYFDLRAVGTRVHATLCMRRNPAVADPGDLVLDGEGLQLETLRLDGRELVADDYRVGAESLVVFAPPERFALYSEATIAPEENTALEGLYRSGGMFCTQCEAEGFRKITWYPDRPDVMATFRVRIEADAERYPVLLSNGNPGDSGALADGRHFAEWDDPWAKPAYLFALVAGDLRHVGDTHRTASGREVDLRIYVEPENLDKCGHAMVSLKHAMRWDEEIYGREYDLDVFNIVAVNDFNMGAMENKGLNVFNSKYVLARPDTATDQDFQGIEGVIAHEYFHNWTGNRITCRDWFQLSLKEGFTVYRDQEFSADMNSRGVKRIEDVRLLRAHQFAEDAGPMAHPVRPDSYMEINNFYTVTVYEKGAEVVRMQAGLLGPTLFRKATDLYFERHDGQAVTTEDFVRCMEDASGRDLAQFRLWYELAGTPEIDAKGSYDAAARRYTLRLAQRVPDTPGQRAKPPFHIPVATALLAPDGSDMKVTLDAGEAAGQHVLELREAEQAFVFEGVDAAPVPSLLRGFSAPVKLVFDYSDAELMFLMAHDGDGFNRWNAAQTLLQRVILGMVGARADGGGMRVPGALLDAMRAALVDAAAEPALLAQVLTLPDITYLGDQMEVVDVEGLHHARRHLACAVADALEEDLLMGYEELRDTGGYRPDAASIGRRSLQNCLLSYLSRRDAGRGREICLRQYGAQNNMSDVLAALARIADSDWDERAGILADFADRWGGDPLVMDKWFSVQAQSTQPDTLQRVVGLMEHPAFSIRNPNKVRALIGAFVNGNPYRFHAADGTGYRFLADRVLQLDALNPQIAARLARPLGNWRRYAAPRRDAMLAVLRDLDGAELSRDVREIVGKSLDAGARK